MSEPRRLLDGGSDLGRAMLASGIEEGAPAGLRPKIHAAVLASAVGAAVTASSTAAAAKTSSLVASLGVAKWVGIVAVSAVMAVGVHHLVQAPSVAARPATSAVPAAAPHFASRAVAAVTGSQVPRDIPSIPDVAPAPTPSGLAPGLVPASEGPPVPVSPTRPDLVGTVRRASSF